MSTVQTKIQQQSLELEQQNLHDMFNYVYLFDSETNYEQFPSYKISKSQDLFISPQKNPQKHPQQQQQDKIQLLNEQMTTQQTKQQYYNGNNIYQYIDDKQHISQGKEQQQYFQQWKKNQTMLTKTKNLLRNFGNAQNQYILYHYQAQNIIDSSKLQKQQFYQWIRGLKLETFQHFKQIWENQKDNKFKEMYRKLCRLFYLNHAIPYTLHSRIKNNKAKYTHLKFIYRFLEGLKNPKEFAYFKKSNNPSNY